MSEQKLSDLATQYGGAIGDVLPTGTHFVLLVYRAGSEADVAAERAGIAYVTDAQAHDAVNVLRAFLAMIDANAPRQPG